MTTARNRATDRIRCDRALATKFGLLVAGNRAEVPDDPEVHGLLAMMIKHESGREERFRDYDQEERDA